MAAQRKANPAALSSVGPGNVELFEGRVLALDAFRQPEPPMSLGLARTDQSRAVATLVRPLNRSERGLRRELLALLPRVLLDLVRHVPVRFVRVR